MAQSVQTRVIAILAEQALMNVSEVNLEATLEELGIDSLGLVEAVFAIEETFDVQVPFNANDPSDSKFDISNVQSMIKAVDGLVAAAGN
ncbi:phosphopantetheine-binding protein [Rhodobacterales bacterium 52_120_T64]|nr:phosphopantetheine-binding protein [Rhodobacterales bacterium 52_120_T64]